MGWQQFLHIRNIKLFRSLPIIGKFSVSFDLTGILIDGFRLPVENIKEDDLEIEPVLRDERSDLL